MLKSTLALGLLFAAFAAVPARAAMMECSEANMMKMQTGMEKMDAGKKEMASKEMMMAKDSMAKKDDQGCMTHMQKAMEMMPQ